MKKQSQGLSVKRLSAARSQLIQLLASHSKEAAPATIHASEHKKHKAHLVKFMLAGGALGLLLSGIILVFFNNHSLIKARLAGIPVSDTTNTKTLEQQIKTKTDAYKIQVASKDKTESFSLADAGMAVDTTASINALNASRKPDNIFSRLFFWKHVDVPLKLKTDDTKLNAFIDANLKKAVTPTKDAQVGINGATVTIAKEQTGTGYTLKDARGSLLATARTLQTAPLVLELQTIQPSITEADVRPVKTKVEALMAQNITFTIDEATIKVKPADIGAWLDLSPVAAEKTVDITVNSGKVLEYLNRIAKPYTQPPVSQVLMPTTDGSIQVLIYGRNGTDVVGKEAIAADVAKKAQAGSGAKIDMPVKYASYKTITAQPKDKWLIVDVTTKRMYAYEQTNLVKSFLITAGAPASPTVLGQYSIYSKVAKQDMRGRNADGSRYFQPNVQWINYFHQDYAIHGNYWRPTSYFGNVNSSHGCVGIFNSDAQWLYSWAPVGTTVIVHN